MDTLSENPSMRNFTMLSRKMQELFFQYIISGRNRAPPESELTFLISTFQFGAKTDRRALQSKFKSWAKRMVVENHKLKLICTGKEIISLEDSCKVVMHIHFQGHLSVDQVIKQIQRQYTWTKKNFGLDREMIVDFILKNCNNLHCIRAVKSAELLRNYKCNDFIKDVIISSESSIYNQQNYIQLASLPAAHSLSLGHLSTNSCDIENVFPKNIKITDLRSMNPHFNNSKATFSEEQPKNFGINIQETNILKGVLNSESNKKDTLKAKKPSRVSHRSFRKPKNVIDLQSLLRAAEKHTDYPTVLNNPKTKFLGSFGLAPKRICSKRTLSKVEKEKKRKKAQYIQNLIYNNQNRKNLRDRNKLNKIKQKEQSEKRAYLDKFKRNSVDGVQNLTTKSASDNLKNDSCYFSSDEYNNNSSSDNNEVEILKVVSKKDKPEVVEIILSSDDEKNCKSLKNILTNNNKTNSLMCNFKDTKNFHSQHKTLRLKSSQLDNKAIDSIPSTVSPETPKQNYPIFKQTYVIPSNSKGEVAVLPSTSTSCSSKVLSNQDNPVCSINSRVKLSKDIMKGKKAILQPISSVAKSKNSNMQKLSIPGITNKIPHGTNVFLMQKQPSGMIKMLPCRKIVTANNTGVPYSKETSKGHRPISVVNPVSHVGLPVKARYRTIYPAPERIVDLTQEKALDANKHLIDKEMTKLSKWIGGMKDTMARTYFQLNVQRSKQRLESQLNAALAIVKNVRRKLCEIEKLEEKANHNILPKNTNNVM